MSVSMLLGTPGHPHFACEGQGCDDCDDGHQLCEVRRCKYRAVEDIDGLFMCASCAAGIKAHRSTEATRALDHFLSGALMKDFEG
jgi:hypothetical protein